MRIEDLTVESLGVKKMLKKITGSILTIMLMAGMFLGAAGVVIPEPVHADDGYYEVSLTINTILDEEGRDASAQKKTIFHVSVGGDKSSEVERNSGEEATAILSSLSSCPDSFGFHLNFGSATYYQNISVPEVDKTYTNTWDLDYPTGSYKERFTCKYTYKVTHFHSMDEHKWTYTADGNVITAKCTAQYECPLEAPTLTIDASDKTYDGKPAAFALTPNSTWTSQRFEIPELFPDRENAIKAGKYNANCMVYGVTAEKRFTINPRGVLVGGVKVKNKEYDGNKTAVVDTSKAGILGVLEGDEVGLSVTGEYEDPEEGADKNVHLTYTLTGADAGNYYIIDSPTSPATVKASIYVMGNGGPDDYDEGSGGNGKKANSSKSSPDTGDTNDIKGALAMMLVSAGALGAMGYRRRRENRR